MGLWGPVLILLASALVVRLVWEWVERRRHRWLRVGRVDSLLGSSERQFAAVLRQAVGPGHLVLAKVPLATVVQVQCWGIQWLPLWRRACRETVDFLLVDAATWRPRLVIQLVDECDPPGDRRAVIKEICQAAGLPCLRVTTCRRWKVEEIAHQIDRWLLAHPTES